MQEEQPQRRRHRCISGDAVRIRIKMEPKSLTLTAPLHWEVNKLKCMLCNAVPKLEFGMVRLEHDGMEIPGALTLGEMLQRDWDRECLDC
jgi:hypothetical protein